MLQCTNGVSSSPVEGRTNICQLKRSNSNTVWFNIQTYIYIYTNIHDERTHKKTNELVNDVSLQTLRFILVGECKDVDENIY